jgi:hypothetical protein
MSRATQGLQVLLIISIMLNVVLGVTTYLYNKQAFEKTNAAVAAEGRAQQAARDKQTAEEKFDRAKKIIGYADLDIDALEKKNEEDQQFVGLAPKAAAEGDQKQANVLGYNQMVTQLSKTVDVKSEELKKITNDFNTLQVTFRSREAAKDGAIATLDQGREEEKKRIQKIEEDARSHEATIAAGEVRTAAVAKTAQDQANVKVINIGNQLETAKKQVVTIQGEIKPLIETIRKADKKEMDVPSGEITWVSLPTKTVWINRGRADYLQRGIRFTVYSAESNTAAKAVEKGSVEVTRIVADHQAECRIVDDKFADPMSSGDKIFTAFWSPGQQLHFALCGSMNLDGDGRNQINEAIGLVKSFGGVVDCWLDAQGHRQGAITVSTKYIVNGDPPDKGSQETVKNNGLIQAEATRYQLHNWSLDDFRQKTNYQKSSSLEQFGAGASGGNATSAPTAPKAAPKAKAPAASKAEDDFK